MKRQLSLRPVAKQEISEAHDWYEDRRVGLGEEFLEAVEEALVEIERAPLTFPLVRGDVRRAVVKRFPYSILFLLEPEVTVVVACFHGSRDPRRWHERR